MHNLLRCRRGSAAFATVAALVPLIGVVALGAEAGSWYVTKQHAQNAADAAAISGGLRLRCSVIAQTDVTQPCTDTNSVDYRAKQFAAQNAFCNAGDISYPGSQCVATLPTGTSQTVQINSLTSWNGVNGNFVQAIVSQQQPVYLAAVLGMSIVNIGATAIARVDLQPKPPCILALEGSASFQGSATISSPNCGIASNSTASNAFDFTGNGGLNINAPSFSVGGCSQTGGNQCDNVTTYAASVPNPLSGLDSAMSSLTTANFSGPCGSTDAKGKFTPILTAYTPTTPCYNTGSPSGVLNGTYFFNGSVTISGNTTISGTANLILFGGATLSISGNPSIQLTASTNPQVPSALSSVQSLMNDLLIYDPETTKNLQPVAVTGDSNSYFNGIVYVPNSPVTYTGNSSVTAPSPGCFEVIAYAVAFSGNTNLDATKCIQDGTGIKQPPQPVRLVQ
jgi:hypothetical protein